MTFLLIAEEGELITPELERKSWSTWTCKADWKVITGAIDDCAVDGHDNTLIAKAYTAFDKSGRNTMVVREYSMVVGPEPSDNIHRKRVGLNVSLKARMDNAPPGPRRNVPNTGAVTLSAHPELRAEFVVEAMPNTLYGAAVKIPNNPGASLVEISGDMLTSMGGQPCVPMWIDGREVGLPIMEVQPPTVAVKAPDGVGWFAIYDYGHRQQGLLEGTGSFLPFRSRNDAGEWGDWAMINGGLIDRTKGREQGDMDVLWHVDGAINGVAGVGNMTASGGDPAAWEPIIDGTINLGNPGHRWVDLFLSGALHLPTVRKQINGVARDCVAIESQVGTRYLVAYEADK